MPLLYFGGQMLSQKNIKKIRKNGLILYVEGADKSGKSTYINELSEYFTSLGMRTIVLNKYPSLEKFLKGGSNDQSLFIKDHIHNGLLAIEQFRNFGRNTVVLIDRSLLTTIINLSMDNFDNYCSEPNAKADNIHLTLLLSYLSEYQKSRLNFNTLFRLDTKLKKATKVISDKIKSLITEPFVVMMVIDRVMLDVDEHITKQRREQLRKAYRYTYDNFKLGIIRKLYLDDFMFCEVSPDKNIQEQFTYLTKKLNKVIGRI